MTLLDTKNLSQTRKTLVFMGIALLCLAVLLCASTLLGIFSLDSFAVLGHSGIRTLAGIAVAGCILAAIGFFDE